VPYPPENKELLEKICLNGAVLTEYPFGTPPNAANFPARNRIISGMSLGVLVVEAGEKSGSLITARIAADQGRSIFAIPGSIDSAVSRGTNKLIKQGAKLVDCIDDILEEILPQYLPAIPPPSSQESKGPPNTHGRNEEADREKQNYAENASPQEARLLSLITEHPVDLDELVSKSGLSLKEVMSSLLFLEVQGLIKQLPGKKFVRKE
jgi:DNA processing protein